MIIALVGLFVYPKPPLRRIPSTLISVSILLYMLSKTIRFWKHLASLTCALWIVLIIIVAADILLPLWIKSNALSILDMAAVVVFTVSTNATYKQIVKQNENGQVVE
jgi:hypothetical protein